MQYVSNNLKRSKKTNQVEVIELFLAKLATLCILSKGLKNFPIQLINPLSDSLQYASTLVMKPLPCNNYIYYRSTSLIILVNDMTSEKCKP